MNYEKKTVSLPNGETYHYIEQGTGPKTILLVHGNMSSSVHYHPMLMRIPNEFKVYAIDLRGFGDSTYVNRINHLKEFAEDLSLFMDRLHIKKASLVGWSTGGGIALEFASRYPSKTEKIVLIESTSHKGYPIFKKDSTGVPQIGVPYATKEEMALDPIQVAPAVKAMEDKNVPFMSWLWDQAIYTVHKPDPQEHIVYINETLKQRNLVDIDWALATLNMSNTKNVYVEGDGSIHNIKAPVLHIWSKKDLVVPNYMLNENVEALKDQSEVIIYEHSGHSPLVDVPDQLTLDILRFIK